MALYRKNMGSPQQLARIAISGAAILAAGTLLHGAAAWLIGAAAAVFGMTGLIGWCPMCAIAGRKP